ncbi:MAG: tRNA epoxyqueuosine(34) reductase QueG [Acidiferrobacteraceae bacterium]|nr:tRNA epoxyqueuosine(34) reductase QueG [Acidiferrobacteraceae bacterium]|tara:strand:- start:1415 stop:2488 length:1074 start_codon:yes stop_codon:yes gene_type:complete
MPTPVLKLSQLSALKRKINDWSIELGFSGFGVSDTDISQAEQYLFDWLNNGQHGDMHYMEKHGLLRSRPNRLITGTVRILTFKMQYLSGLGVTAEDVLSDPTKAYISRYALGRDYHKIIRKRLAILSKRISRVAGPYNFRPFTDSAPVMEKPLAVKSGLGWMGKHTNLIDPMQGSWFFLGEVYTDLPLPLDQLQNDKCGACSRCIKACPTGAITGPYQLDARLCISYLTIESKGSIPLALRPLIGNRIFGCDDCQLVCPWNKDAETTVEMDFKPRHELDSSALTDLFLWSEDTFMKRTEGSAIRRVGYIGWLRNIAVGLGNAPTSDTVVAALQARKDHPSELVREHTHWALEMHGQG